MCPNDPPPDRPVLGNASAGSPVEIRYLVRHVLEQNPESGAVATVSVVLSASASQAYRAELSEQLGSLYPSAEVVVE